MFETTIRILGGLAAAFYHSGGDEAFLMKAVEFADRWARLHPFSPKHRATPPIYIFHTPPPASPTG